jgi:hypothetical protein
MRSILESTITEFEEKNSQIKAARNAFERELIELKGAFELKGLELDRARRETQRASQEQLRLEQDQTRLNQTILELTHQLEAPPMVKTLTHSSIYDLTIQPQPNDSFKI